MSNTITSSEKSPAGLLLTVHLFICYQIAAKFFEGPFTSYIYSQAAKNKTAKTTKAKKVKWVIYWSNKYRQNDSTMND